ncbi:MAG TPA: hypothetical protein VET23_10840 [Chitinophagaceae bacterium]|nr:hypothetical protein [Chitinophagaceae bacterium]
MTQERFSPEQSLQVIQSMIEKAKNQFSENGHLYLLWGWAVFICSISQFVLLNYIKYEKHYIVWFSMWLVVIYQIYYLRKKRKRQYSRTYTDEIIGFVWISFFILMVLFTFLYGRIFSSDKYYGFFDLVLLALYGMPTFLSGIILKFKPLIIGGICCWLLSIIASFIMPQYHLLMLPVAMMIAWIIPGYKLRKKYKQQTA